MDLLDIGEGRNPNYRYIWICMDLFTKHTASQTRPAAALLRQLDVMIFIASFRMKNCVHASQSAV